MLRVIRYDSCMDAAQLSSITDARILREIVAEKLVEIAAREALIAQRDTQIAQRDARIAEHERTLVDKNSRIAHLIEEIARLRRVQFAARSEKMDPAQRCLFDEAVESDLAAAQAELDAIACQAAPSVVAAPTAPRNLPKRRALPRELPRVEVRHEPAACTCADCGAALVKIGEHVSEKLDVKPIQWFVRRDVHPQYACRACQTVVAEPVAPTIVDRGIAAPGLIAHIAIGKYVDHQPLYRQEAIFARSGVEIGRASMAQWLGAAGVALAPLVAALRTELLGQPVLHADETPVALLDPGAGKTRRAYLFAYRSAGVDPIVVFDFCANRSGQHARQFLGDFRGALMVDDYAGYKALFAQGVTELGCWAHARRKFVDQHKASGSQIAKEAIGKIAALYRIEAQASDLDVADRHAHRQGHAVALVDALHDWLVKARPSVAGNSGTAHAIDYTL